MANQAEYVASIGLDLANLEKGIGEARQKLAKMGSGVPTTGIDSFLSAASAKFKKFGADLEKVGTTLSIGLTAPLVLLGKKIVDIGFSYEKSMNTFAAVTHATATEMGAAARMAEKLGSDMSLPATSAADAALAMTELAKGGLSAAQAMDAAKGSLQLAAAAQVDGARAAEITANALNIFGLAATDAGRVADILAATANAASGGVNDMALALKQSGTSAAALKIPIDDLATAIGEMAQKGILGSDAGTSLKTFLSSLTPTSKEAAAAMKQLGIDAFDAKGNFVGLEQVIAMAQPALAKMTDEQQAFAIKAAFGSDAQRAANIILGEGTVKFNEMKEAVNQSGAAAALAEANTKGLSGAWDGFISQLETAGLQAFKSVQKGLEGFVRSAAEVVEGIGKLDSTVFKMGVTAAGVAASAGPIALLGGKLLSLGPQGAIVAAVIAGVAAIAAAYATNFGEMTNTLDAFASGMSRAFGAKSQSDIGAWQDMLAQLSLVGAQTVDILLTGFTQLASLLGGIVRANLALMKGDFSGAFSAIKEGFSGVSDAGEKFNTRLEQRQKEMDIVLKSGAKGLMDYLRVVSSNGGKGGADAFYTGYSQNDPIVKLKSSTQKEVESFMGSLRSSFMKGGSEAGKALYDAAYGQTHHSPFFMIHWLEDAAKYANNEAPTEFGKAGSKMGEKLKAGFTAALGNINEFLGRAIGGTGTISDNVLDIILRKFPKVATELKEQAQWFHDVQEAMSLYATMMGTASGRSEVFTGQVHYQIQKLLEADKVLRENLIPEMSNLNNKMGETIAVSKEMGEAIAKSVGSLVEATLNANSKALKDGWLLWANSAKAAKEWGKVMSDAVKQAKEDIRNDLGDGIGGALVSLAEKYHWHLDKTKAWSKDIGNIIDTMPGKWGEATRKVTSTLNQWLSFGNSILSVLNKVFGSSVPSSMDGLIKNIVGVFSGSGATQQVGGAIKNLVTGATQAASGAATAAGAATGGAVSGGVASGIASGTSSAVSALGGVFGALTQAVGVFASTFHDDSKSVRFAGGFLVGGIAGGILSAIFGGPSDFEKEKRALQLDSMKANIASVYEDIKSKMVDVMAKGEALLNEISVRTDTPRKAIKRFVNQLGLMLELFIDESKRLAPMGFEAAKAVTENLGGAFDLMLGAVNLNDAIRNMQEATTTDVAAFKASSIKLINALFEVFESVDLATAKQSSKKSERLKNVIDFATAIPNAIKAAIETTAISDEQISTAFTSARKYIDAFFKFSDELIGMALNKASKGAGQLQGIFESGKSMFEFFGLFKDYKPLEDAVLSAITSDLQKLLSWGDGLLELAESGISKFETLQSAISKMASAMKGAVTGISGLSASITSTPSVTQSIQYSGGSGLAYARGGGSSSSSTVINNTPVVMNITMSLKDLEELATAPDRLERIERMINAQGSRTGQRAQGYAGY